MHDCCTPKMLKETEQNNTVRVIIFIIGSISTAGGWAPPGFTYDCMITRQVCSHTKIMKYKIWHNQTAKKEIPRNIKKNYYKFKNYKYKQKKGFISPEIFV